ncbi:flagellar type III secretion system protein FliR [Caminibacter mediatlanticus TB-2]|uniref:Flagellar biosynthetic protein FliR n=1 Tax=Caminibacter mediatlanticus TB-2 TaxID=391592 RepID=A0AAI9AFN9_9BACT|nr:flagellar biosynthetic protein FliR [Caminibacter mediatlanticus]EDM23291.1 Flagellar biosynthesis protein FliR [Caminibacter mediatlanticus TB-2]QCT94215.1 flagellar type III secretion system protein FliR [Caminibacter mediatlanticus TB-2]
MYSTLLSDVNVVTFLLLFIRISSFLSFLPFFNYMNIPMNVKAALSIWLSILFFPIVPKVNFEINLINILLAIFNEIAFAFFVGMALQLIFDILKFAAEQISFVMGFTMANVIDPNFGGQSTILSQFFIWIAILVFLTFGGDHLEILLLSKFMSNLPFGAFFNYHKIYEYFLVYMGKYFMIGVGLAFPIIAISLMSDIIFGMIMKTMPQFNLLVVGFPIKIFVSFIVLMAILSSMMLVFSREIKEVFKIVLGFIY